MGAITTVMFQRMYMGLTLFSLLYVLINLKIIKNDFEIDKKMWIKLGAITLLGFLTQYYFCIMAAVTSLIIFIAIVRKKDLKRSINFVLNYIKIALIGIVFFPKCINDIFFSYRGVSSIDTETSFFIKLSQNTQLIGYSFSIPLAILVIALFILTVVALFKVIKEKNKNIFELLVLIVPIICYVIIVSKISPYMEYKYMIRYIMCILPVFAIDMILLIDYVFKNKKRSIIFISILTILISTYGFTTSEPKYLFKGYSKYLEIAEEYKNDNFVYVGNAVFNQIQSIPEFMKYKESLILEKTQLDYLNNNEGLKDKNEFILSIKKYLGYEEILKEVLTKSGFTQSQILLDDNGDVGCIIYKITK